MTKSEEGWMGQRGFMEDVDLGRENPGWSVAGFSTTACFLHSVQ
jgi:hypothetical protein